MKRQDSIDTLILCAYSGTDAINAISSCNIISKLLKIRSKILVMNSDLITQLAPRKADLLHRMVHTYQ
jgi:hypothetical protein